MLGRRLALGQTCGDRPVPADASLDPQAPLLVAPDPARAVPAATVAPASLGAKLAVFAGDIKVAHTVFALPFALLSAFLAAGGSPRAGQLLLVLACMVTA